MGLRGLRNCRCSVFDCFGWTGSMPTALSASTRWGLLRAVKVSSVLARFIHANNNISSGQIPPPFDPSWGVDLPHAIDSMDPRVFWVSDQTPGDFLYSRVICGNRVFRHSDGKWYVAYMLSHNVTGDITEDSHFPTHLAVIAIEEQEVVHTCYLPSVDPAVTFPNWYAQYQGDYGGGGHRPAFAPVIHGMSRDSWVISAAYASNQFTGAGHSLIQRHIFSTGESAIALGSNSIFTVEMVIQLPAQSADDGLPWCIAKSTDPFELHTGPWLNDSVGDLTNPTANCAELIGAELVNRLDNKPGFPAGIADGSGIDVLAYTRLHGFDYVLVKTAGFAPPHYWYDGRRQVWSEVVDGRQPTNIYSFEDGTVALASSWYAEFIDPENSANNWVHLALGVEITDPDSLGGVRMSGNGKWLHLGSFHTSGAFAFLKSTADLEAFGTDKWHGNEEVPSAFNAGAWNWSLSRLNIGDGPIAICHRDYDWANSHGFGVQGSYINRLYCGHTTLAFNANVSDKPGTHYMAGAFAPMNFEAVPGCKCCAGSPNDNAEGF